MADANEPGAAVLAIFDQLINRIKSARPIRSDKKPAELGFVYSQLVLGMMVDPNDYMGPWSPAGGDSIQDAIQKGKAPPATSAAPAAGAPATTPAPDRKYQRAMDAAFKTAMLVDRLIMVTKDNTYLEYPGGGRKISAAYEGIVNGMQPLPPPPIAPDVQKRIDNARKVLYVPDDDGDLVIKSKLYKAYEKNSKAYAQAVADYALAQADASTDPAKAQVWPVTSKPLREAVDDAYDTLKTEGRWTQSSLSASASGSGSWPRRERTLICGISVSPAQFPPPSPMLTARRRSGPILPTTARGGSISKSRTATMPSILARIANFSTASGRIPAAAAPRSRAADASWDSAPAGAITRPTRTRATIPRTTSD